jgi:hypothetical protein
MLELYISGNHDVRPNTISFSSVVDAWARSNDHTAPQRAEAILNRMEELYKSGNHDVKPSTISFASVIGKK